MNKPFAPFSRVLACKTLLRSWLQISVVRSVIPTRSFPKVFVAVSKTSCNLVYRVYSPVNQAEPHVTLGERAKPNSPFPPLSHPAPLNKRPAGRTSRAFCLFAVTRSPVAPQSVLVVYLPYCAQSPIFCLVAAVFPGLSKHPPFSAHLTGVVCLLPGTTLFQRLLLVSLTHSFPLAPLSSTNSYLRHFLDASDLQTPLPRQTHTLVITTFDFVQRNPVASQKLYLLFSGRVTQLVSTDLSPIRF